MDTKLTGDVAEQIAILQALKHGWGVLRPVGDRLAYDLVFDIQGSFVRIQVKSAWYDQSAQNYVVDTRRTKTNRRIMKREYYTVNDFDFALVVLPRTDICYVFPVTAFISYKSTIQFVEVDKRQRRPTSYQFRNAWNLISQWAGHEEIHDRILSNSGKPPAVVIPSQVRQSENDGGKV